MFILTVKVLTHKMDTVSLLVAQTVCFRIVRFYNLYTRPIKFKGKHNI